MAFNFSPSIVRDGLVLYLDAANTKSYPGSGTTWSDISRGGNSGTLVNGPTFNSANGGSIVFDGVNDYVNTSLITSYGDFTVGIWFKHTGNLIAYQRLIDKNYINGFWIGRNSSAANSWGGGVRESLSPYGRYITLVDGQWHYIVSRREGTTHTIFGDGITNTVNGTVSSTALNNNNILIGRSDQVATDSMAGNISQIQIYNRALSASEILQNFNATKTRYGLT